jgi:hypothetical protein
MENTGGDPVTDAETSAAIEALAHRVKARDKAIRDGDDHPDAEPFALEFLTALRGRGWRPTPAKAGAAPVHAAPLADKRSRDEEIAAARADVEARAAAARAAKESAA